MTFGFYQNHAFLLATTYIVYGGYLTSRKLNQRQFSHRYSIWHLCNSLLFLVYSFLSRVFFYFTFLNSCNIESVDTHSRNQKILYTKTITSLIFSIFKWVLTTSHDKDKNSGLSVCSHSGASLAWCQILVLSNSQPLNPIFYLLFPQPHLYICTQRVLLNGSIFSSVLGHSRLLLYLPFTIMVCSRPAWEGQLSCHSETFPGFFGRNSILLSLCFFIRLIRFNPEGRDYFSLCVPFSC